MKKIILIALVLIALSGLVCVNASDLDNATDSLSQQDPQELEVAAESNDTAPIGKSNDTDIVISDSKTNDFSSKITDSSAYLVLDNDADKENICLGDYVTWIVSVENRGPGNAKSVKVFNQLPDGLKYVKHTATQGTFNPNTGIWDIGNLLNGSEVFLYIKTLAVSLGEKVNKANLTCQSINLNKERYEEEEIDVFDCRNQTPNADHSEHFHEKSMKTAGNPIGLVLLSLFGCFMAYSKK